MGYEFARQIGWCRLWIIWPGDIMGVSIQLGPPIKFFAIVIAFK